MAKKPTYEELEQRVKELEKEAVERKLAEESLRQSISLLQHIADHLPVMFSYVDSDERYIFSNRQFEDSFGPESVVGKTIEEVLGPEIYEEVKPRVDAVLAGDDVDYERIGLTGKGDKRCLISPSPFKTRLMVLSEGKSYPDLLNSHFMAEAPIWAKRSDSRRVLTEIMRCLSISLSCVGLFNGALDLSLYQSETPVW